jgi:hypothetical protein
MTVLLVLFFFAAFLLIDYFRSRNAVVQPALQVAATKQDAVPPRLQPALGRRLRGPRKLALPSWSHLGPE